MRSRSPSQKTGAHFTNDARFCWFALCKCPNKEGSKPAEKHCLACSWRASGHAQALSGCKTKSSTIVKAGKACMLCTRGAICTWSAMRRVSTKIFEGKGSARPYIQPIIQCHAFAEPKSGDHVGSVESLHDEINFALNKSLVAANILHCAQYSFPSASRIVMSDKSPCSSREDKFRSAVQVATISRVALAFPSNFLWNHRYAWH